MEKKDLRIVFLGTPEFAVESLRRLVEGGYNVVGVVTMPDKPAGRGKHLRASAVKEYAVAAGLPVMQPEKLKDEVFVEELRNLKADLFIVIAFRMLPEVVWQMPRFGTFNLHASLLPAYRGAAPINWAVINGESRTGVTTFFLKHEIDTGNVIDREAIEIRDEDNVGTVHDRLMELGADLTIKTVDRILAGNLSSTPQAEMGDDDVKKTAPKIFKETCRIDWNRTAKEIHNLVRGLSPYPGAWSDVYADGVPMGQMKVFETKAADVEFGTEDVAGAVLMEGGRMFVKCGDGALELLSVQAPGKKRMPTADFLRGIRWGSCSFDA